MAARQGAISVEEIIRRKVTTIRRWKKTNLFKKLPRWDFQFSIMTYNILSQNAVENHRYLYRHCNPACMSEEYRISRILPEILHSRSDIICLQEVEQHLFDNRLRQVFHSNGFASIFKKKTTCKSDGCAILWRRNKFILIHQKDVEFRSKDKKLLDRDNVGLIVVLRPNHPKFSNLLLHVATTHLLFNPRRGDIKLCQLRWLLAEIERMALKEVTNETRHYHPVILCGDFNFQLHSPLYDFLVTGSIDVVNVLAGNLSGQADGRNKGRRLNGADLLLHELCISEGSRFERIPTQSGHPTNPAQQGYSTAVVPQSSMSGQTNPSQTNSKLLPAVGSSNDPRLIGTLLALDNQQLAAGIKDHSEPATNFEDKLRFSHDFKFVPAYKYHHTDQRHLPITSNVGNEFNHVDHIFYNVKRKRDMHSYYEGSLRLLSTYTLMHAEDVIELGGLPNAALGSDHLPLIGNFALCAHR